MSQVVKHYIIYFLVLFQTAILFNISTFAQNKTNAPVNFPDPVFEHLTIADGLPENSARAILQDHLGYMWLGTQNGLVRYDGYNMLVYQPDPKDSLSISDGQIWAIYEDKSGTLWIGTANGGLNKFDRTTETFIRYTHSSEDSLSINSNMVISICEDKTGKLFVGTIDGLNLVDKASESFRHIEEMLDDKNITPVNQSVWAIMEDWLTGNIYVGYGNKIFIYDIEKGFLVRNKDNVGFENDLGEIQSFCQSVDGTIWIAHSKGIARFNTLLNTIKYYQLTPAFQYKSENVLSQLIEDENGLIWGALSGNPGLVCFDPKNNHFKRYIHDPNKQGSLSSNDLWTVYRDRSGIIWAGTGWAGVNKWDKSKQKFERVSFNTNNDGKRLNTVYTIVEDQNGIIWFGTDDGLNSFNRFTNEFKNYKYNKKAKINTVTHIYKDKSGVIWFGTFTNGLGKFDTVNGSFHFYSNDADDSTSISNNDVRFILPDKNDFLWIGTRYGGLNRFDKKTGKFTSFKYNSNNPKSLTSDQVNCIYEDRNGKIWVGTNGGDLNLFDQISKSFSSFDIKRGFTGTTVTTIYEDRKGNFWIGDYSGGVYLFDRDNGISNDNITEKDGLANNYVRAILEDNSGNLWISSEKGISRFNLKTYNIKNYLNSDSFIGNRHLKNSACRTSTGEMLFGTSDGFIIFHPDSIKDDPVPPQVVISNVSFFNRPDEKLEINGLISEMDELDLSYDENDLRFDYVGLHFGEPSKNKYKYKLEGFDKDWVNAGTQRNATYTNLDAGEYIFRVTACNADGMWNEEGASLKIIIPPPFWATWLAYSIYFLFFLGLLYNIRRYELNRTQLKNLHKLDEVKLKEREETDRMKSRFFANISHEFRTPLTLILGPSENIINEAPSENATKQAGAIKRNANRLLVLINQLLDLSKLEAGKLELKASKSNIVPFIKGITMSFESVAEKKDITLKVIPEKEQIELNFDKEKMIKVMANLLSNAFKFTPDSGQITVSINSPTPRPSKGGDNTLFKVPSTGGDLGVGHDIVEISVRDTGIGISEEELPKLFDRFYQVDSSQTREHEGTGIGLALTKELVELHHGTISVDSKLGVWTEFTVTLLVGRNHLKDEEVVEEPVILSPDKVEEKNLAEYNATDSSPFDNLPAGQARLPIGAGRVTENDSEVNEDKNIVLVVEDNSDVREFIKDSLGNNFKIEEASNGEQGVRKAEQIIPDLIISDIMMPKMDGNELARILKNDEKTSHIPIILLTAKSEQESKLEGLETGADDYLTKPFDTKELQIRIKNLINIRRKLQEKYGRIDFVPVKKVEENLSRLGQAKAGKLSNLEEQFMSKVIEVIENHLAEEEFSIEQFGKEVGMSRVQLHRKLKALSGKSASNYLRSVRLSKAKHMIEEQKGNISEIAYSVGFSSPQYFTRCFKEEFGFPPSDLPV